MQRENHNHENQEDNNHTQIDVNRLTVPMVTITSIIAFFMWITYIGTTERAELRQRLTAIETHQVEIQKTLDSNNLISNNELSIFCLRAQLVNKDWKCPSINHTYNSMNSFNEGDIVKEINRLQQGINAATAQPKVPQ